MKRKWKIALAVVCVVALGTVAYAATAGSAGTETDPLVTLSYLTQVFAPEVEDLVEQTVDQQREQYEYDLNSAVDEWDSKVQDAIDEAGVSGSGSSTYKTVTLSDGATLIAGEGCEVIVCSGAAAWTPGGEAGIVNSTSGAVLSGKQTLKNNNLYLLVGSGVIEAVGTTQTSAKTGTVTADSLNVRSGPGSSYDVVGKLSKGASVVILGSANGWYEISSGSLTGYVSADYVTVDEGSGSTTTTPGTATLLVRGSYQVR